MPFYTNYDSKFLLAELYVIIKYRPRKQVQDIYGLGSLNCVCNQSCTQALHFTAIILFFFAVLRWNIYVREERNTDRQSYNKIEREI